MVIEIAISGRTRRIIETSEASSRRTVGSPPVNLTSLTPRPANTSTRRTISS